MTIPSQNKGEKIWVVFKGEADLPWLKILKPGFRHCFLIVYDGRYWLSIDPMLNYLDMRVHYDVPADENLPAFLWRQGYRVVRVRERAEPLRPAPFMVMSCVEVVKRYLGIHNPFIVTPWQLYRHLQRQEQTELKGDLAWEV